MNNHVLKEISRLEKKKNILYEKRNKLNEEISEAESKLKALITIKSQYEKLDQAASEAIKDKSSNC